MVGVSYLLLLFSVPLTVDFPFCVCVCVCDATDAECICSFAAFRCTQGIADLDLSARMCLQIHICPHIYTITSHHVLTMIDLPVLSIEGVLDDQVFHMFKNLTSYFGN